MNKFEIGDEIQHIDGRCEGVVVGIYDDFELNVRLVVEPTFDSNQTVIIIKECDAELQKAEPTLLDRLFDDVDIDSEEVIEYINKLNKNIDKMNKTLAEIEFKSGLIQVELYPHRHKDSERMGNFIYNISSEINKLADEGMVELS